MPNAEGRAATKRAPAKKTAAAAAPAEEKTERHVRTPLERAQSVYDKAKATSDRINERLTAAKGEVAKLEAEATEAKVTLDWAASHPLLVKARKDAEGSTGETPARDNTVEWDIDANRPMSETAAADEADADATPTDARNEEGEPTGDLAGEPEPPVDVFEQGEPSEVEPAAPAAAPFPFDAPPAVSAQPEGQPFDFDEARVTRV